MVTWQIKFLIGVKTSESTKPWLLGCLSFGLEALGVLMIIWVTLSQKASVVKPMTVVSLSYVVSYRMIFSICQLDG